MYATRIPREGNGCQPFYGISYDTLIGSHLGETGGRLRQVIDYIGSHECVTLLDEFETIGKERADDDEVGEMKRIVASLLVHLERLPPSTVVIAATNHPDMLDRAAWRRFQIRLRLDAPDRVELGRYLAARLPEIDRRQIDGAATAMRLEKASYAEANELCDDIERRQVLFGDEDPEHMFRRRHARWMRQRGDHDREDSEPQ